MSINFEISAGEEMAKESPENSEERLVEAAKVLDILGEDVELVARSAEDATKRIDQSELSDGRKHALKDRLMNAAKKVARVFSFAAALAAASGTADYHMSRHEVKTVSGPGLTEYLHEDPTTTHTINMISGKEDMTREDKIFYLRTLLERDIDQAGKDPQTMSLEDLAALGQQLQPDRYKTPEDFIEKNVPSAPEFDPEVYEALWQLEKENGNPKVKFRHDPRASTLIKLGSNIARRSFYDPVSNTVIIDILKTPYAKKNFIAELSHAKQFNEQPVSATIKWAGDIARTGITILREQINPRKAYSKLYREKDSWEHEAHGKIEPSLLKELGARTPHRKKRLELRQQQDGRELVRLGQEEDKALAEIENWLTIERAKPESISNRKELMAKYNNLVQEVQMDFSKKKAKIYAKYNKKLL